MIFNNKKKIVISPHYDDLVLSLGGVSLRWKDKKCVFEDWVVFSKSNYLPGDFLGNKDMSKTRIDFISSKRLKEERAAIKAINVSKINLLEQSEALIRIGVDSIEEHKEGFPFGINEKEDKNAVKEIKSKLKKIFLEDVQIFVPLAAQEHTDHLIVRKAVEEIMEEEEKITAQIFFYEDIPYIFNASLKEQQKLEKFIKKHRLTPLTVSINIDKKIDLFDFYKSQAIERYRESARRHAMNIGEKNPCEKVYYLS